MKSFKACRSWRKLKPLRKWKLLVPALPETTPEQEEEEPQQEDEELESADCFQEHEELESADYFQEEEELESAEEFQEEEELESADYFQEEEELESADSFQEEEELESAEDFQEYEDAEELQDDATILCAELTIHYTSQVGGNKSLQVIKLLAKRISKLLEYLQQKQSDITGDVYSRFQKLVTDHCEIIPEYLTSLETKLNPNSLRFYCSEYSLFLKW